MTIVADSPTLKIGIKRRDLKLGEKYVIRSVTRGRLKTTYYQRVTLIDLRSGNKAVVQYDVKQFDGPMAQKNRKAITKVKLEVVSCADILATEEDWDRFPKVWNATRKRLMLDRGPEAQMAL